MKKYDKQCWFNHNITCILLKYRNEHSSLHIYCNNTNPNDWYPVKINLISRIKQQLSNFQPSNLLIALSNWALKLSQLAYKK